MHHEHVASEVWHQVQRSADLISMPEVIRSVTSTPSSWYDALDPATSWCLLWTAPSVPDDQLRSALEVTGRFGYRHGRLLLGSTDHPCFSVAERLDDDAAALFDAAMHIASSRAVLRLPTSVAAANASIAAYTAGVVCTCTKIDRPNLVRTFDAIIDVGFALALAEQAAQTRAARRSPGAPSDAAG